MSFSINSNGLVLKTLLSLPLNHQNPSHTQLSIPPLIHQPNHTAHRRSLFHFLFGRTNDPYQFIGKTNTHLKPIVKTHRHRVIPVGYSGIVITILCTFGSHCHGITSGKFVFVKAEFNKEPAVFRHMVSGIQVESIESHIVCFLVERDFSC